MQKIFETGFRVRWGSEMRLRNNQGVKPISLNLTNLFFFAGDRDQNGAEPGISNGLAQHVCRTSRRRGRLGGEAWTVQAFTNLKWEPGPERKLLTCTQVKSLCSPVFSGIFSVEDSRRLFEFLLFDLVKSVRGSKQLESERERFCFACWSISCAVYCKNPSLVPLVAAKKGKKSKKNFFGDHLNKLLHHILWYISNSSTARMLW